MTVPTFRFRTDLEGLRAVAVLLVVAYHVRTPFFEGGFIGVDVFFVLSGYLITWLLVTEANAKGRINFARFYARRARRLVPALAVVLVVTSVVAALVYAPFEQESLGWAALSSALYISNITYAIAQADYFSVLSEHNPFLHTWSLAVEEQFYLVWPLVIAGATGLLGRARPWLWLGGLTVASLGASLYLTAEAPVAAFYLSPTRAWQFGVGGLAVLVPPMVWETRRAREVLGWTGLAGLAGATLWFNAATPYPGVAALLPTLATVGVIRSELVSSDTFTGRALSIAPFRAIGKLSYSWYLWHWPALIVGGVLFPDWRLGGRVLLALVALGLSAVTYVLVEDPVRHHARLKGFPRRSLVGSFVVTALVASLGLAWSVQADRWMEDPVQSRLAVDSRAGSPVFAEGCATQPFSSDLQECTFGPAAASHTAVLLGDSQAATWFPLFDVLLDQGDWRVVTLVKLGCAVIDEPIHSRLVGGRNRPCEEWLTKVPARVAEISPDLTVLGMSTSYPVAPEAWGPGVARALGPVAEASGQTVVLDGFVRPGYDVPACVGRRAWRDQIGVIPPGAPCRDLDARGEPSDRDWPELPGLVAFDVFPFICPAGDCPPIRAGRPVYRDVSHVADWVVPDASTAFAAFVDGAPARPPAYEAASRR